MTPTFADLKSFESRFACLGIFGLSPPVAVVRICAGHAEEAECRRRFNKFATKSDDGGPDFLSFQDYTRLLEHYEATTPSNLVLFFYAMDRNRDGKLDFQEFFLGSTAADPQTVHILNSFTGKERAAFTFDYYDANRSGFLELDEFQKVCRDCAIVTLDETGLRRHCFDKAMELGLMQERPTPTP